MSTPEYQERVIVEFEGVVEKASKLNDFIQCDLFKAIDRDERVRLKAQMLIMLAYADILGDRIEAF